MRRLSFKYLALCILNILLYFSVFAQEKSFSDIDKYFSKKEKASFERALEYQNAFCHKIFPDTIVDISKIQISVITDIKEFGNIVIQKKTSGYYSSFDRKLVICKDDKFKNTLMKTTFHELSHALLHLYSGDRFDHIPPWLNEGLAEYLEGMTYSSKNITHHKSAYLIARVKTLIELRDLDLADFVDWEQQKFIKESFSQDGYGYAVGYCMVLFLMNKYEKDAYSLFRSLIDKNKASTEIFDIHYKGGFSQFEKDFFIHYSK